MVEIKNICGDVLLKVEAENLSGANLRDADLYGADLRGANLRGADLRGANLRGANLRGANLQGANLRDADLYGADLRGANLRGANLRDANLRGADLQGADLQGANLQGDNLQGANLYGADLHDADLRGANLRGADLRDAKNIPPYVVAETSIIPEGTIVGWKRCLNGIIVKVEIGADVKRSNATGRKCRAEYVNVLEVIGAEVGISQHDGKTEYRIGSVVRCDKWEEDRWQECAGGIHFFLTRYEAESY